MQCRHKNWVLSLLTFFLSCAAKVVVSQCFDREVNDMTDEPDFANEVSEFLRKSCPQRETWRYNLTEHFKQLSYMTNHPVSGVRCRRLPVNTGSAAEFYIAPMLSCVGDVDVMYHYSNELAVSRGHPPPTRLPENFDRCVDVYEIVDSHLPGYVSLALTYRLSKSSFDGRYMVKYVRQLNTFLKHNLYITTGPLNMQKYDEIHGPARTYKYIACIGPHIDTVPCIRCFEWPLQAADWSSRQRFNGWPDAVTIDAVVGNGCDVVGAAHPLCKNDEWLGRHQWRLSFSRAEVMLLNSWTQEQQIVYHMLRTFVKTERLTATSKKCGTDTFSNYHVKMLMLWACEVKPQDWWKCESNLVGICVKVMHFLNEWLTEWRGQHYFVNEAYFSDYLDTLDIDTVCAVANSTTVDSLAQWFVDNYIRKCAELCPENISLLCNDVVTKEILHDAVTAILEWRDPLALACKTAVKDYFSKIFSLFHLCRYSVDSMSLLANAFQNFFKIFLISVSQTSVHFPPSEGLLFFQSFNETMHKCVDITSLLTSTDCCTADSSKPSSVLALTKAITFMKFGAKKQRNSCELSLIELSRAYLLTSLKCKDSDSDSIYCLANVYLAVLCYTTGQFQKAIDHCTLVTRLQDHSKCSLYVAGERLPKVDDDIDRALGLAVFYQYVRSAALILPDTEHTGVFTTELFAHYFLIKRLLVTKFRLASVCIAKSNAHSVSGQLIMFRDRLLCCKDLFVDDLLLCKLSSSSCQPRCSTRDVVPRTPAEVIKLPTQFSMERLMNLMQFCPLMLNRPVASSSIIDYLPLYLYRCELYERCMDLCRRNASELTGAALRRMPSLSTTYHEFIQLMDNDIVSLIGLALLVDKAGAQSLCTGPVIISQLTLSLYLLTQSQIKLFRIPLNTTRQVVAASLTDVLTWIADAEKFDAVNSFDQLMLKLTEQKAVTFVTAVLNETDAKFSALKTFSILFQRCCGLFAPSILPQIYRQMK